MYIKIPKSISEEGILNLKKKKNQKETFERAKAACPNYMEKLKPTTKTVVHI